MTLGKSFHLLESLSFSVKWDNNSTKPTGLLRLHEKQHDALSLVGVILKPNAQPCGCPGSTKQERGVSSLQHSLEKPIVGCECKGDPLNREEGLETLDRFFTIRIRRNALTLHYSELFN